MRTGVTIKLSPIDRLRLLAIAGNRNSPQKHVWRSRIVLATADGLGTMEIMRTAEVSKTAVWRWQERFMVEASRVFCATRRARRVFPSYPTKWPNGSWP